MVVDPESKSTLSDFLDLIAEIVFRTIIVTGVRLEDTGFIGLVLFYIF